MIESSEGIRVCARCGASNRNPHPFDGAYGFEKYLGKGKYEGKTLCWICRDMCHKSINSYLKDDPSKKSKRR